MPYKDRYAHNLSVTMDRHGHLFPIDNHQRAMDVIAEDLLKTGGS